MVCAGSVASDAQSGAHCRHSLGTLCLPPITTRRIRTHMANGEVCITGAVPPQFPKATCPSGYFYSQYNGWEPRFGLTYRATNHTVVHTAVALLDDHNNTLIQENQNIRLSWPVRHCRPLTASDIGLPTNAYWSALRPRRHFLGRITHLESVMGQTHT